MSRVTVSTRIDAEPQAVWDVLMDPDSLADWVTIHRRLGKVSDRPLREGSTLEQTLCLRGANFKVRWTVADIEPCSLAGPHGLPAGRRGRRDPLRLRERVQAAAGSPGGRRLASPDGRAA